MGDISFNAKLTEIGERLDVVNRTRCYRTDILRFWNYPAWLNFIMESVRYHKFYVDKFVLEKFILECIKYSADHPHYNFVTFSDLRITRFFKNLSSYEHLPISLIRKYEKYLDWGSIAKFRKFNFRFMWLMRHNLNPNLFYLKQNLHISKYKLNRFVKYLDKNGELIGC